MKNFNHILLPFLNKWQFVSKVFAVLLGLTLLISGCSVESKLNRSYKGKSFTEVIDKMGAPTNIENLVGGGTIRSYVNKKMLRETPINTGHFQYDEFNSPKVLRTEITQFFVDPSGKVKEIKYSCEYSR
ncbi:MAG: hypothetical protein M1445_10825 [Bacteroidetes bacterium]|nr:hypothetical protein [Bacteroidota bacterium]MCL6101080.1 hypothetical protein [Bacteroidota bacterium]